MPLKTEDSLDIFELVARYNHTLDFGDTEEEGVFAMANQKHFD